MAETQNGVSGSADQNTRGRLCGETPPRPLRRKPYRGVGWSIERMTLCHVDGDNVSFVLGSLKDHCLRSTAILEGDP
jgi:hypothetical protein